MKKVLGYLFLGIGGFLGLSIITQIPTVFNDFSNASSSNTAYSIGFVMGKLFAMLITIAIIFLLIWLGRKWIKKKETPKELQDIGNEAKK